MVTSIEQRLATRADRVAAATEICQRGLMSALPALVATLDKLTWDEIGQLMPHLPLLGEEAVPSLCTLLKSTRKQTAELVTSALGAIGDARASAPLVAMMEAQAGSANAIRARDALSRLGSGAIPALSVSLESANWEVRYHAVQALAIIGDPAVVGDVYSRATDDRSAKVREAAEDALGVIPSVEDIEWWSTLREICNPYLASPGFFPRWRIDVVNAHSMAFHWRFDRDAYEQQDYPLLIDDALVGAIMRGYKQLGSGRTILDTVVLMGEVTDAESHEESFCVAFLGLSERFYAEELLLAFVRAVVQNLPMPPRDLRPSRYWLGGGELIPYLHLEHGRVIRYDRDDSREPDEQHTDEEFGTGLPVSYAKGAVDQAWVVRSELKTFHEHDAFTHIPSIPDPDPAKRGG